MLNEYLMNIPEKLLDGVLSGDLKRYGATIRDSKGRIRGFLQDTGKADFSNHPIMNVPNQLANLSTSITSITSVLNLGISAVTLYKVYQIEKKIDVILSVLTEMKQDRLHLLFCRLNEHMKFPVLKLNDPKGHVDNLRVVLTDISAELLFLLKKFAKNQENISNLCELVNSYKLCQEFMIMSFFIVENELEAANDYARTQFTVMKDFLVEDLSDESLFGWPAIFGVYDDQVNQFYEIDRIWQPFQHDIVSNEKAIDLFQIANQAIFSLASQVGISETLMKQGCKGGKEYLHEVLENKKDESLLFLPAE